MLRGKLKVVMAAVLLAGVTLEFAGGMMHNAFFPSAAGAPADDTDSMKLLAEKALKAGGGEKLRAVKAWTFTVKLRGKTITHRRYVQLPDCFRWESEREVDGKLYKSVTIINGDKGWTLYDGKVEEMPAETVAGAKQGHFWVSAPLLGPRLLSDPTSKVTKLPEVKIGERTAVGVTLPRKTYGPTRLYFDKETGRLLKLEKGYKTPDGKEGTVEVLLSDFRKVGGVMLPHKKTQKEGGKVLAVWDVTEYKFADRLDAKLFEKPYQPAFVTEFLAIKKEVEAKQQKLDAAFNKETTAGKNEDERTAALLRAAGEESRINAPAVEKVLTAVRAHAADPDAVEALVWVANGSRGSDPGYEAVELLRKYHLRIRNLLTVAFGLSGTRIDR